MTSLLRLYNENRAALWLIAAFTLVRLAIAATFGLGTDEAHYVLYARFLDFSYFDHPPLVGWTHALFFYTLGTNEFLVRLPAIILFAVTSFLCYRFTLSLGGEKSALYATAALNGSFLLSGLGLMLLPETLLLPLVFGLIYCVRKLDRDPAAATFALLGLLLGLAGLAKYTAVLFVPAIVLYWLIKKRFNILFNPRLLLTAGVALVVISPVIYWNVQHDFISFRFQSGHIVGGQALRFGELLKGLGAQFGAYSPPLFCLAFYGLYKAVRNRGDVMLLSTLIGCSILLFFLYASLLKLALPHWSAVFYTLFIPLGVVFLNEEPTRLKKAMLLGSIGFSLIVALLLQAELGIKAFRFPDYKSPFRNIYGMKEVLKRANDILARDPSTSKALAVSNWTEASRTIYYDLPYGSTVFVIGGGQERYSLWATESPLGRDILFLNSNSYSVDVAKELNCRAVQNAGHMDIMLHGGKVDSYDFVWCRSFGGKK